MASDVLFTPFESSGAIDAVNRRVSMMLNRVGFYDSLTEGDRVAIKIHPGERNNISYLRPSLVRSVADQLSKRGFSPFVAETTTLYCRERYSPEELIRTAKWNGFCEDTLSCPFVVADLDPDIVVKLKGKRLQEVGIAKEIAHADALLVLSHVTGHGWTAGLAGAMKQLGMGCVGRKTKADVHLSTTIDINADLCDACKKCLHYCKGDGIEIRGKTARLTDRCVRCGVCIASCPRGAISYSHDYDHFARALSEAASGVMTRFDRGRVGFVNFLIDLTWHCDCEDFSDRPVFQDIGVLVSLDPVAADQASADLINSSDPLPGTKAAAVEVASAEDKLLAMFGIEWWKQLDHAESLGLGSREYKLDIFKS